MASLLTFVKKATAQVNPLDNGRTWQNPQGNHNPGPAPSAFHQLTHNAITNAAGNVVAKPVYQAAQQIVPQVGHIATIVPNEAKSIVGFATGNRQAGLNAYHAAGAGLGDAASFAQFVPRTAVQLRQSAAHVIDPHNPTASNYTPKGAFQQAVFGKQPIQTLQDVYKQTRAQSGTQSAIGTTALNLVMDLLVAKGGIKSGAKGAAAAKPVIKAVPKVATQLAQNRVPLNEGGGISLSSIAERHPAVQQLDQAANLLRFKRDQMLSNGMSRSNPELKATTRAYEMTLNKRQQTLSSIQQGGYVKMPDEPFDAAKSWKQAKDAVNADWQKAAAQDNPKLNVYNKAVQAQGGLPKSLPKGISPADVKQTHVFGSSTVKGSLPNDVDVALTLPEGHPALNGLPFDPGRTQVGKLHYSYFSDSELGQAARNQFINTGRKGSQPAVKVPSPAGSKTPLTGAKPKIGGAKGQQGSEVVTVGNKQYFKDLYNPDNAPIPVQKGTVAFKVGDHTAVVTEQEAAAGRAKGLSPMAIARSKELERAGTLARDNKAAIAENKRTQPFSRTASQNTALNPYKITLPQVKEGDYETARLLPQAATNPIDVAAGQAIKSARRMSKDEQANIPKMVEDPKLVTSSAAKEFIARHNDLTNMAHGTSQALGGNTNFLPNYFRREVDLAKPEDAARWQKLLGNKKVANNPKNFKGINNYNRVFGSIDELHKAGFKLVNEDKPIQSIIDYADSVHRELHRQALSTGFNAADAGEGFKPHNFNLDNGKTIPLSNRGIQEIQGYERLGKTSGVHQGYRAVNRKLKQTILSPSEFHAANIGPKVSATLLARGHPKEAAQGLYDTFRAQVGSKFSDKLQQSYLKDRFDVKVNDGQAAKLSTVEAGARIGAPLKFGSDYATEGRLQLGKAGFGEKTIFEKSMPALQGRAIQAAIKDLNKKGLSLDSPEAHALGTRINELMGFINVQARNLNPARQRELSDVAFAPQFTRAKWATLKSALKDTRLNNKSLAGSYARRAVVANAAADFAFISAVGYLVHQKSDDARDLLLRSIFQPTVPTPFKDSKGNTLQLKTPSSYASEALGLVATLERGQDGHLHPVFKPSGVVGNVENYGRNRLAVLPSNALKVKTNENYAGRPLYDPNAKVGTQVAQGATTIVSGLFPIIGQGLPQTEPVKKHLPGDVQDVITANTPGTHPLLKSVASSFGLTPTTDKTVGKGQQTTQYFSALDQAKKGLNSHEAAALELYAGNKKNPVTGKYDVMPNVNDTSSKAKALLDQPKVVDHLVAMNQTLKGQGQKVDPLWLISKDRINKTLAYQAMPPGGPDRTHWLNQNKDWYVPLSKQRTAFFNSIPKGDANKPNAPIDYPNASPAVAAGQEQFFKITDSAQRASFLQAHPEVQQQLDAQVDYNNKLREAQGYSALDTFPKAAPGVQKIIDTYNAVPKGGGKRGGNLYRAKWIEAHPKEFAAMTDYFTQASLYGLEKDASQAQFKDTELSSKGLGDIYNLGKNDVKQGQDANGKKVYALTTGQSGGNTYTDQNGNTFADLGQSTGFGSGGSGFQKHVYPDGSTKQFSIGKIATKKFSAPKGVKVKKLSSAGKAPKTRKLSVSKIPKIKVG